jgi:RNA polymerase sigma-70 factor, ECF subfamily
MPRSTGSSGTSATGRGSREGVILISESAPPRTENDREPAGMAGDGPGRGWMLAFQDGDQSAFDRIVIHYRGMVWRFIGRYLQDLDRAEDLSQEVFLRVYRARKRYRPTAQFRTWLFTIAARLCLNDLRSRRRERRVIIPLPQAGKDAGPERDLLQTVTDPDSERSGDRLELSELEQAVDEAIAGLPPAQRAAVLLLRFEELSYREIAEALGISAMAVKSLINRARENLRSSLGRYLGET